MTDAEETKLTIHKLILERMIRDKENEIYYYGNRCKNTMSEIWKTHWKEIIKAKKAEYEALDYAWELIKKELDEVAE